MRLKRLGIVAAGLLVLCGGVEAQASIIGQTNRAHARIGTGYFDGASGPFVEVDALRLYDSTPFTFGGPAVLMPATGAGWRDLVLTTNVTDTGTRRTVNLSMTTADDSSILDQSIVDTLTPSEQFFFEFYALERPQTDDQMVQPYDYTYTLLGLDGKHLPLSGTLASPFLIPGSRYISPLSPAGPDFFGLTPRGFSMTFSYNIVPAPGTAALFACTAVLASCRRR